MLFDHGHQLARVLLRGPQSGVKERAVATLRAEPLPGQLGLHMDGLGRALIYTGGTTVAGDGVHNGCFLTCVFVGNRVKAAHFDTGAAAFAYLRIDDGHSPTQEVVRFQHARAEHQFQVGGIHIGVGQDGPDGIVTFGGQVGKSGRYAGFAGTSFATENDQLLHRPASRRMS